MPESLKYIASPFIRNTLIRNNDFLYYYNLLEKRELLNEDQIKDYQLNQLKKILIYSDQNVPYYHELFKRIDFNPLKFSDFGQMEKIPFLTRELVTNNYEKLISRKKVNGGYYIGATGGSSGLPLKFLLDFNSI